MMKAYPPALSILSILAETANPKTIIKNKGFPRSIGIKSKNPPGEVTTGGGGNVVVGGGGNVVVGGGGNVVVGGT